MCVQIPANPTTTKSNTDVTISPYFSRFYEISISLSCFLLGHINRCLSFIQGVRMCLPFPTSDISRTKMRYFYNEVWIFKIGKIFKQKIANPAHPPFLLKDILQIRVKTRLHTEKYCSKLYFKHIISTWTNPAHPPFLF